MIKIKNKKDLEVVFSENFGSPYFPMLADVYLREGNIDKAKTVCDIGLQHSPENTFGKFMLAKISLSEGKSIVAEKWLKQVVKENPGNFKALRMLIRLEMFLKRSSKTIRSYIDIILQYIPNDSECIKLLNALDKKTNQPIDKKTAGSLKNEKKLISNAHEKNFSQSKNTEYKLENSMATFSMLNVLKSQKHYYQAIAVLNMLEDKNIDLQRVKIEKNEIQSLIKSAANKK